MYRITNEVYAHINQIEVNLKSLSNEFNSYTNDNILIDNGNGNGTTTTGNTGNVVETITDILNIHQNSLTMLDYKTKELKNNINQVKSYF